jgi:hypothetical protein
MSIKKRLVAVKKASFRILIVDCLTSATSLIRICRIGALESEVGQL